MARSSEAFNKREFEKRKAQKKKEKEERKEERKASGKGKSFEDMIAYVDENGNLSSTPPDQTKKRAINENDINLTSPNKGGNAPPYVRQGFIKFFDTAKGYGFIKDKQSQEEYFFHINSTDFQVTQGDQVKFDIEMGQRGMNAVRVTKLS